MARNKRLTFECSPTERELIISLAERLRRFLSDPVRYLILKTSNQQIKIDLIKEVYIPFRVLMITL